VRQKEGKIIRSVAMPDSEVRNHLICGKAGVACVYEKTPAFHGDWISKAVPSTTDSDDFREFNTNGNLDT